MQNEFLFTKINLPKPKKETKATIDQILCFAEFYDHEIG